ncbi:MAG TPA: hypothetical protein VGI78_02355 [Acetobacteraceae bacterium]|jgi:hypothetical protein
MGAVGAAVAGGVASGVVGTAGSMLAGGKAQQGSQAAQQELQQQRQALMPWVNTGGQALGATADLLGLNGPAAASAAMANFQQSPGYQWQLQQGLRGVDAGAAAQGMLRSGATMKAEETYGQGLANQDFTNYYNRLAGLSTLGQNAAAGGASTAQTGASLAQGAGNTQSSIYGNLASGLGSTVNGLFQNPAFNSWLTGSGTPATSSNQTGYTTGGFYGGNDTFV